ncbi:MAG: GNAT family N-acetyltransferase [Rickettsiales bacterium]|nr:GNAT family N-acetyltransferase [Rickettsiales bacterium]
MEKTKFPRLLSGGVVKLARPAAVPEHAAEMFELISRNEFFYPWRFSLSANKNADDCLQFIKKRLAKMMAGKDAYYDIIARGKYVGEVYARDFDWDNRVVRNIGYFMDGNAQRNGYATDAVITLSRYLFSIGIHRVCLFCHYFDKKKPNLASERVAQKAGYVFEGTSRDAIYDPIGMRYGNEHMFSKLSTDPKVSVSVAAWGVAHSK